MSSGLLKDLSTDSQVLSIGRRDKDKASCSSCCPLIGCQLSSSCRPAGVFLQKFSTSQDSRANHKADLLSASHPYICYDRPLDGYVTSGSRCLLHVFSPSLFPSTITSLRCSGWRSEQTACVSLLEFERLLKRILCYVSTTTKTHCRVCRWHMVRPRWPRRLTKLTLRSHMDLTRSLGQSYGNNSNVFRIFAAIHRGIVHDNDSRPVEQVGLYARPRPDSILF